MLLLIQRFRYIYNNFTSIGTLSTIYISTYVLRSCLQLQEEKIDDSLEFLILASDGLWDVFSNEVCEFTSSKNKVYIPIGLND